MVKGVTYVVYVLPVVFSIIFGSIVMADILQEPGRELNLLRIDSIGDNSHDEPLKIIGLEKYWWIDSTKF